MIAPEADEKALTGRKLQDVSAPERYSYSTPDSRVSLQVGTQLIINRGSASVIIGRVQ